MDSTMQAIQIFLSPKGTTQEIEEADEFLTKFERSQESWIASIQILQQSKQNNEVLLFAAKMLKSKMEKDFGQLSKEDTSTLPARILQICQIHKSSRNIQGLLADAFSFLYLQTYDRWPQLIEFIKVNFYHDLQMQSYVLLIYQNLLNKDFTQDLIMDNSQKKKMIEYFNNYLRQDILKELDSITQNQKQEEKNLNELLSIMSNLVEQIDNSEQILHYIENNAAFDLALKNISKFDLQENCTNVIVSVLEAIFAQQSNLNFGGLLKRVGMNVFRYFDECQSAFSSEDYDSVSSFQKVFVAFGRVMLESLTSVNGLDQFNQEFLKNMMLVTSFETSIINTMWKFWYDLIINISMKEEQQQRQLIQTYYNMILQLSKIAINKLTFSDSQIEMINAKKSQILNDEKIEERYEINGILFLICRIFGADEMIKYLAHEIENNKLMKSNFEDEPSVSNQGQLEGLMFALNHALNSKYSRQSIDDFLEERDKTSNISSQKRILFEGDRELILNILKIVLQGKYSCIQLNETILLMIISQSDQVECSLPICQLSFEFIFDHLNELQLAKYSILAFKILCFHCSSFVERNYETLKQKIFANPQINCAIINGFATGICQSDQSIQDHLIDMCIPFASNLMNYTQLTLELQNDKAILANLRKSAKAIQVIIQQIPQRNQKGEFPHQILRDIFKQIWPILKLIMENRFADTNLIENIISLVKQFIVKMSIDFDIFLIEFLEQAVQLYQTTYQSGILYIVEQCIKIFSDDCKFTFILSSVFQVLVPTTLQALKTLEDFTQNPCKVEDFFGLLTRVLKYSPQIYFESHHLINIMNSIMIGIQIQHKESSQSLLTFMELIYLSLQPRNLCLLKQSFQEKQISSGIAYKIEEFKQILFTPFSAQFNVLLFQKLAHDPFTELSSYILDVFMAQISAYGSQSELFFKDIVLSFSEDILTQSEKISFFNIISTFQQEFPEQSESELTRVFLLIRQRLGMYHKN